MPRDPEFDKLIYGPSGKKPEPSARQQFEDEDYATQFKEGTLQGLLNVPETLGQLAERGIRQVKPDFVMPFHERARDFRNRVESSPVGIGGEVFGSLLPAGLGEYAIGARALPYAARFSQTALQRLVTNPAVVRGSGAASGAAQGLLSRPVSGENQGDNEYFTQGLAGGVAGAIGGRPLARYVPPHIGNWLYNLPAAVKHAIGVALIRGAGRVPGTAATAAGALTPEPGPQK